MLRHSDTCQLGDPVCRLSHDLGIQRSVDENGLAYLFGFLRAQEVAAPLLEFLLHGVIDGFQYDHRLLRCTDHTVVKGLGMDHRVDRQQDIRRIVKNGGGIAGTHSNGRLAAGVCSVYHTGAAGCKDDVRLLHDHVGQIQTGHIDPANDARRRSGSNSRLQYHLCRGNGIMLGTGVRTDDDAVPGFQCKQGLKNSGGCGVGGGDHRSDHPDGLGDFFDAVSRILLHHAAGLGVFICVVDVLRRIVVLDDLVLYNTHAGFLYSLLCQGDPLLACGKGGCPEDGVHLLLGVGGKLGLCLADFPELCLQSLHAVNNTVFVHTAHSFF